jgi:hypothetical protein
MHTLLPSSPFPSGKERRGKEDVRRQPYSFFFLPRGKRRKD